MMNSLFAIFLRIFCDFLQAIFLDKLLSFFLDLVHISLEDDDTFGDWNGKPMAFFFEAPHGLHELKTKFSACSDGPWCVNKTALGWQWPCKHLDISVVVFGDMSIFRKLESVWLRLPEAIEFSCAFFVIVHSLNHFYRPLALDNLTPKVEPSFRSVKLCLVLLQKDHFIFKLYARHRFSKRQ